MAGIMASSVSCMKTDMGSMDLAPEDAIFLSGAVYSSENPSAPEPINGIRIVVGSYANSDRNGSIAIARDTAYTDASGNYGILTRHPARSYYIIEAQDVDGDDNGGTFNPGRMKVSTGRNCDSMESLYIYLSRK